MLIDLIEGSVIFSFNGHVGPRAFFGDKWKDGVVVKLAGEFPDDDNNCWTATLEQPRHVPRGMCAAPLMKDVSASEHTSGSRTV